MKGEIVEINEPDPTPSDLTPEDLPLEILFEDKDVVVVVKPAGMVVHPAPGHLTGTMVHALLAKVSALSGIGGEERPGIVHRLDVGTSGVMVVAKNDRAHRRLSSQFAVHSVDRRYLAMVHKVPIHDNGRIESELARDPDNRLKIASVESGGRIAITRWSVRARGDRVSLMECKLETGRTHQVRVHLSESGFPIVGDRTYTRRDATPPAPIRAAVEALDHPLLHAWHLGFTHPRTGEWLAFFAPPPADFIEVCALAGLPIPAEPQAFPA